MKRDGHIVKKTDPGSIAEEMEIAPGDKILRINGEDIEDIFDYQYLIQDEYIEVLVKKPDGDEWLLEIDKDEQEDHQVSSGAYQYFFPDHEQGTSLHDVKQSICR